MNLGGELPKKSRTRKTKRERKEQRLTAKRLSELSGVTNQNVVKEFLLENKAMLDIWYGMNRMDFHCYDVVDGAETEPERDAREVQCARALTLRCGIKKLMYAPYRGPVVNDWMIA